MPSRKNHGKRGRTVEENRPKRFLSLRERKEIQTFLRNAALALSPRLRRSRPIACGVMVPDRAEEEAEEAEGVFQGIDVAFAVGISVCDRNVTNFKSPPGRLKEKLALDFEILTSEPTCPQEFGREHFKTALAIPNPLPSEETCDKRHHVVRDETKEGHAVRAGETIPVEEAKFPGLSHRDEMRDFFREVLTVAIENDDPLKAPVTETAKAKPQGIPLALIDTKRKDLDPLFPSDGKRAICRAVVNDEEGESLLFESIKEIRQNLSFVIKRGEDRDFRSVDQEERRFFTNQIL